LQKKQVQEMTIRLVVKSNKGSRLLSSLMQNPTLGVDLIRSVIIHIQKIYEPSS
jgi:hypothetical protein